jgi:hypothetical protein
VPGTLSEPQVQSRICVGGSELQKSLPAEADGAVHMTAAARTAAARPIETINARVFIFAIPSL